MDRFSARVVLVGLLAGMAVSSCGSDAGEANARSASLDESALTGLVKHPEAPVCGPVGPGFRRCHAHVRLNEDGQRPRIVPMQQSGGAPANSGFLPADLISAYNLGSVPAGSGTVAIVDAYDYAKAESDLATYRSANGLPACTTANGCFQKIDQSGGSADPSCSGGQGCWADEMMLDLDMVSAICPACKIILVETASASSDDLNAGVAYAVQHADAVSNSYGGGEDSSVISDTTFRVPGVLITASAGDSGYGPEYPATSPYVLAVGGTSLVKDSSSRGWSETAWTGTPSSQNGATGSGCSQYIAKPSYQTGACTKRMESDISAVADPSTGVAIYDSNIGGWAQIGGTSASAPMMAALFTRLGLASTVAQQAGAWAASHTSAFNDVTTGSNQAVGKGGCASSYECVCQAGYDGPTGYGTPNAVALLAAAGGIALPSVSITAPANNATVRGTTQIIASASVPSSATLASLTILIDGTQVSSGSSATNTFTWDTGNVRNGSHNVDAIATDTDGGQASASITVRVSNDFTLTLTPAILTSVQGDTVNTTSLAVAVNGSFPNGISLSASGLPAGASYEFSPAQVSGSATSTMSVLAAIATPGVYMVTVTGTSGGLSHSTTLTWTVQQAPSGGCSGGPSSALSLAGLAVLLHLRARRRSAQAA